MKSIVQLQLIRAKRALLAVNAWHMRLLSGGAILNGQHGACASVNFKFA